MDRPLVSSQMQSNGSQNKALIQSISDPSVSGRQQNRFNSNRRRNDFTNKNASKFGSNATQRQSTHFRGGRPRASGPVANAFNNDIWQDHLSAEAPGTQVGDKSDKWAFGSKKHNLNHLLNFTFDSRDQMINDQRVRRGQPRMTRFVPRFNKEHFLQANCQFVVNDLNDYSKHSSDPDISIDWDSIEEIRFNSLTAETYCPICLDTPLAPKITRCGHIYCWSCVLHYLALSDQKWRKCPICFDSIQSQDLKTVSSVSKMDYKVGDFITLSLMKRKKGSTIASPVLLYDANQNCLNQKFEPLDGDPVISSYQKLLIASPYQVLKIIIERERVQLMNQMVEDKDTPEVCFIESALNQLKHREETLRKRCEDQQSRNESMDNVTQNYDKEPNDEFYYFYQSEDGQHIYLHSLNVRMLKHEFGSLENSPQKIFAKIVETEWESMTEENRKRHRYLQHLPLTCEFRIVELEFINQLISDKTLEIFRPEVLRRQKMRAKREREERRRERHIQVEQNKRIHGIYPRPKYQLDNMQQFPVCNDQGDALRSLSPYTSESSTIEEYPLANQTANNAIGATYGSSPTEAEFPSFAAMLREGKAKPVLERRPHKKIAAFNETNESDDEYHRPQHNYSLSDAFTAALQLKSGSDGQQNEIETKKGGSKKRKNKPKLVMSTGMKRSY